MLSRRTVMWSALGSGALATIPAFLWHHDENAIRIGLTKAGPLVIAKALGWLDQAMAGHGRAVSWHEFEAGPQLLEAMAAGALDFGMTGNTPPIFAQANGAALHYAGFEPAAPRAVGLLIHPATRFASGASLSGARIAVQRGSNAHYLVTGLLAQQSASADASLRFLAPADAHAAFARGDVDAWAVWDPLLSDAIGQGARLLADARGISANYYFCMAGRALAADRAALDTILATLRRVERWTNANRDGAAGILASATGLAARTWARSLANTDYGVRPMSPEPIAEQQHIADAFFASGLLPRAIRIPA